LDLKLFQKTIKTLKYLLKLSLVKIITTLIYKINIRKLTV